MSFDFSTLITDRTYADVSRVQELASKIRSGTASKSEVAEFNSAAMKGAYNHTDLNRVTAAMEALKAKLEGYGYAVPGYQRIKVPHVLPEPEPTSRLPEGYTELTHIESTGTQYIDTGFKPNNNTRVVMDAVFPATPSASSALFGTRVSSTNSCFILVWANAGYFRSDYNSTYSQQWKVDATVRRIFDKNKETTTIDGTSLSYTNAEFQSSNNLYLFASNNAGTASWKSSARVYSCQIYDNGTLVRDYVPCINPDGEVGLYDLVTAAFFGNSGTGVFVAGAIPIELPEGYTQVEYIQSSGTQYIDTGWKFGSSNFRNVRIVADSLVGTAANGWAVTGVGTQTNLYYGCGNGGRTIYYGNGNGDISSGATYTNVRATWDLSLKDETFRVTERVSGISLVNINISVGTPSLAAAPFFLFAYNDSHSTTAVCHTETLYGFKIYENSTLVRDYVPCKNPSGVFGLYDLVNNVFYQNEGSGTFAAGEEVVAPATASVAVVSGDTADYDPYTWYEFDWPTPETMTVYLLNVSAIRAVLAVMKSTPSVPVDMERLLLQEANNIEIILSDVLRQLTIMPTTFIPAGEALCGGDNL